LAGGCPRGLSSPIVSVGNAQLRAGVRALFPQDQPGSGRPPGQIEQAGGLGEPGPVAGLDLDAGLGGAGLARLTRRGSTPIAGSASAVWISRWAKLAPTAFRQRSLWMPWLSSADLAPLAGSPGSGHPENE
jgi:hypothetical protein